MITDQELATFSAGKIHQYKIGKKMYRVDMVEQ
jgi:hypothetical protein